MAGRNTSRALQRLTQEAGYGLMTRGATTPGAAPDPRIYGVFGPQYAAALAADSTRGNDPTRHASEALLAANADEERRDYKQSLANAALGEQMLAKIQARGATGTALANQLATEGKYGLFGAVHVNDDGTFDVDPVQAALSNDLSANERAASAAKDRAASFKDLHDAGATFDENTVEQDMSTNPGAPVEKGYGVFSPTTGATFKEQADAEHQRRDDANGAVNAAANSTRAAKGGASDGGLSISVVPGQFGMPDTVTTRMKGAAARQYLDKQGSDGKQSSAPNLPANLARAAATPGYAVHPAGNGYVLVAPSGATKRFDHTGNPQ